MSDAKPSNPPNPKDRIAGTKLPSGLCPDTAIVHLTLAFLEGALKYGRYNWRIAGVSASVYNDAMERHRKKWWNGQNTDKTTNVHHLANLMACAAIMLDAELYGMLNDDRPPCPNPDAMADLIDKQSELVVHLKKLFENHNPRQYKIGDTAESVAAEAAQAEERDRQAQELLARLAAQFVGEMLDTGIFEDGPEMRGNGEDVSDSAAPAEDPAPVPAGTVPEVLGEPAHCLTLGCYEPFGHSTPHADYEGVRFPTAS